MGGGGPPQGEWVEYGIALHRPMGQLLVTRYCKICANLLLHFL